MELILFLIAFIIAIVIYFVKKNKNQTNDDDIYPHF